MKRPASLNSSPCPFLCVAQKAGVYGWLEITNRCNLKCPYCYADSTSDSKDLLTTAELKRILSEFKQLGAKKVMISGGEPTLRSDLHEILKYGSEDLKLSLVLVSNGVLLNRKIIKLLRDCRIPIQLSIDSPRREIYKLSRGVDFLPKVLKNIDELVCEKVEIYLAATLTRVNQGEVKALVDFALEKGIQNVHIGELIPEGRTKSNKKSISVPSIYGVYKEAYELQKKHFLFVGIDIVENLVFPIVFHSKRRHYCNAMKGKTLEIGFDGQAYFCGAIRGLSGMKKLNVRRMSLAEIYKILTKKYREFQVPVEKLKRCQKCEYANICAGGCRAIAYHYHGNDIRGWSPYCRDIKRIIREIDADVKTGKVDDYIDFLKKKGRLVGYQMKKYF